MLFGFLVHCSRFSGRYVYMVYGLMDLNFKLIWWICDEECRKHEEEQILSITGTLVQFLVELIKVLNLSNWIQNAI